MKQKTKSDLNTAFMPKIYRYLDRNGPHNPLEISIYIELSIKKTVDILSFMEMQKKVSWKSETGLYHAAL